MTLTELDINGKLDATIFFDADDINAATAELTNRWIASGEVAHPEVIKVAQVLNEAANRHDWEEISVLTAGATYVSNRRLSTGSEENKGDYFASPRTMESLVPDFCYEPTEILACSASGVVSQVVLKGTSAEGAAFEIALLTLALYDGHRITHLEVFDPDQRDRAKTRLNELS
jgi:hypothetical protein